ncbi:hypothetical protein OBBRIDRAFT_549283 [Obba rivulosa]|uniref:Uncharacterized protein n=1 Tax=Obba rivulosa TaxID=1052685 RepID=A0A8E2AZK3_9APHY|nr:hypothetical protein OBBRIDRAFT_549283 [Obba rivulosa]
MLDTSSIFVSSPHIPIATPFYFRLSTHSSWLVVALQAGLFRCHFFSCILSGSRHFQSHGILLERTFIIAFSSPSIPTASSPLITSLITVLFTQVLFPSHPIMIPFLSMSLPFMSCAVSTYILLA